MIAALEPFESNELLDTPQGAYLLPSSLRHWICCLCGRPTVADRHDVPDGMRRGVPVLSLFVDCNVEGHYRPVCNFCSRAHRLKETETKDQV
jgi:hypothetical protein